MWVTIVVVHTTVVQIVTVPCMGWDKGNYFLSFFPLLLKIDSFLIQYNLIVISPPSSSPRAFPPPLPSGSAPFLYFVRKELASK